MNAGRGKGCGPGSRSWYEEHAQGNEKGLCKLNSQRLPLLPLPLQRPVGAGDSRGQWYQWLEPVYPPQPGFTLHMRMPVWVEGVSLH